MELLIYLNVFFELFVVPFIIFMLYFGYGLVYTEDIKHEGYIVHDVYDLGERMIFYYEDINMFIMKRLNLKKKL